MSPRILGASDKATSTEGISLSSNLDYALSQLGSNTHPSDENRMRALDSRAGSIAIGFMSSEVVDFAFRYSLLSLLSLYRFSNNKRSNLQICGMC
ncbi:hypothetical protein DPMN_051324 [Dreissena polymorpha]|uniref:Uncharacterized protein n=1 Tax=Dreissena polymorpha TaxID=45954 RepID=A0A9D4CJJ5_DREPO|nr:hypothetical protein DPMN_051324 [Dreissena polymorpha]